MFMGDCFWQQMNAQCNGVKVSEIDDYVQQVASLRQRYALPESRRKEFLSGTNFAQASITDRINQVSVNGIDQENPTEEIQLLGSATATIESLTRAIETAAQIGLDNLNSFDVAANTGVVNFTQNAGAAVPDLRTIFEVGDVFVHRNQAGGAGDLKHGIIIATTAGTITIRQDQAVLVAADNPVLAGQVSRISATKSTIIGVGTTFTNDLVVGEEILVIDGLNQYRPNVHSITDDLTMSVQSRLPAFLANQTWYRVKKKPSSSI